MVPSLTPTTSPSLKWGSHITCTLTGPTSRRVLPPGEYDRRYRQGSCVLWRMSRWAERCHLLTFNLCCPSFDTWCVKYVTACNGSTPTCQTWLTTSGAPLQGQGPPSESLSSAAGVPRRWSCVCAERVQTCWRLEDEIRQSPARRVAASPLSLLCM